ncbi:hypothetical protein HDU98_001406 [Podochytrium sp. JEL0797]|nr:hypothetical protein HDU98_001406 [Podochytrium sp. JEL0797]
MDHLATSSASSSSNKKLETISRAPCPSGRSLRPPPTGVFKTSEIQTSGAISTLRNTTNQIALEGWVSSLQLFYPNIAEANCAEACLLLTLETRRLKLRPTLCKSKRTFSCHPDFHRVILRQSTMKNEPVLGSFISVKGIVQYNVGNDGIETTDIVATSVEVIPECDGTR